MLLKKAAIVFVLLFAYLFTFSSTHLVFVQETKAPELDVEPEADPKIRILLVPGHDDEVWGSRYGNLKEADMNLVLATQIYELLKEDDRFEVFITRDDSGYIPELADYFSENREEIISFKERAKKETQDRIDEGSFVEREDAQHSVATLDTAVKLYGINKWVNENKMDAVVHVHFNDLYRKNKWSDGRYKGFAIYVPEDQMYNSDISLGLAESVFEKLHTKYIVSNNVQELEGIVPSQRLIALGANGTLTETVRSILIEYGYIYRFKDRTMRHQAYKDMADLTVKGIKDYYFE